MNFLNLLNTVKLAAITVTCLLLGFTASIEAGNSDIYISKEFGFMAMFPAEVEVISMKNVLGPIAAFSSVDYSKEKGRLIVYQIIAHRITKMRNSPAESEEETYKLIQRSLDTSVKENEGYNYVSEKCRVSSWPAIKFKCMHDGLVQKGVTSYKHGFKFLIRDTYYTVVTHGIKDDKDLEDLSFQFFATFSLIDKGTRAEIE
jgi:hypothetical protein